MFAAEAAAIGLVGGAAGTVAAVLLGAGLNVLALRFLEADSFEGFRAFAFPGWLLLGAVAFATVIGGLAGIYPANRAARLDPIDALRYE
jgi:putative ABC transport system permease protein